MRNSSNITKYHFLSKFYDLLFKRLFNHSRRKCFDLLDFREQNEVLLVGVGTGLDIPYIPYNCSITGIDLSSSMLNIARDNFSKRDVLFLEMNAEKLLFENQKYDVVILNLILSVVENPRKAMEEAIRVLKDDGTILVFDKFSRRKKTTLIRRIVNIITMILGTDINRSIEDIIKNLNVKVEKDISIKFNGNYRAILMTKVI